MDNGSQGSRIEAVLRATRQLVNSNGSPGVARSRGPEGRTEANSPQKGPVRSDMALMREHTIAVAGPASEPGVSQQDNHRHPAPPCAHREGARPRPEAHYGRLGVPSVCR